MESYLMGYLKKFQLVSAADNPSSDNFAVSQHKNSLKFLETILQMRICSIYLYKRGVNYEEDCVCDNSDAEDGFRTDLQIEWK